MLALVRAGIGAALVPEAAMSLHFDDVHFRPVRTIPEAPVELFAAWRSDNDNPALAGFWTCCMAMRWIARSVRPQHRIDAIPALIA